MKFPIIIGIDPGLRVGYAILDINGDIIDKGSAKEFSLGDMIKKIMQYGLPVIIGTDKDKSPFFINQISAKTGAKIATPRFDLKVEEKRKIVEGYSCNDIHESDALASALFAYNQYFDLISRIKRFIAETNNEEIFEELAITVIKEGISIKDAADLIKRNEETIKEIENKQQKELPKDRMHEMLNLKINGLKQENLYLKNYNSILNSRLKNMQEQLVNLKKTKLKNDNLNLKKVDSLFLLKERRLRDLDIKLKEKHEGILALKKELNEANDFLAKINSNYVLKKLDNLGLTEYNATKYRLNISSGNMLLVDDANIYNEKTLMELAKEIDIIVYRKPLAKKTFEDLKFELVSASDIRIIGEFGNFAIAEKHSMDHRLEKKNILKKIIEDYKESRK
jgi:uncharacterized protein